MTEVDDPNFQTIKEDNARLEQELTRPQFEQELIRKYHFKCMKDTDELYYFEDSLGVYINGGEWLIKSECLKYDPEIKPGEVDESIKRIMWSNYRDRSDFDSNLKWISCKNCMVNLLTGETKPNGPEYMAITQIPHVYSFQAVNYPFKIMQFFRQVMTREDIETVLDFIAYCLWRDLPFHRWLLFNGSGRNGKGVTTQLVTYILGHQNVSNETLHRLTNNRFASANLFGMMANIDADMSKEELKFTGMLKMLTGGDDIPAEFKFKGAFSFKNYAKLIFSANQIPVTPDESDAFFARLIIINFTNQFLGDKANPNLIHELTTESELSGFFTFIIRRIPGLLEKGISYADSHTIEDNYSKYMQSSDPIRFFIETAIRKTNDKEDCYETKTAVHESYSRFCDKNKLPIESTYTFSRRLKVDGYIDELKRVQGDRTRVWKNIKLIDWTKPDDEDQETF